MTRFRPLIALLLAATSLATASAFAQDAPRRAGSPDRETRQRAAFDRIDANKDGFIDRSESHAAREALFDRLDANKDGRLSPEEQAGNRRQRGQSSRSRDGGVNTQPSGPTAPDRPARVSRYFQQLDTNQDGFISRAEWLAADDARFARCDTNKDDKLAFGECPPLRGARGQQRAAR
jgi:hypothetical protein